MMKKFSILALATTCLLTFVSPISANGADNRRPVTSQEASQFPYNLAHRLYVTKSGERQPEKCSGTLVNQNMIVTAAHCVTGANRQVSATSMKAYQGIESNNILSQTTRKANFKIFGYAGTMQNDTAVIKLDRVHRQAQNTPKNVQLAIYQQPAQLVGQQVQIVSHTDYVAGQFITSTGTIKETFSNGAMIIDTYSSKQQSGSAIYLNGEIIGTLQGSAAVGCAETCHLTMGTLFTPTTKEKLFDPNGIRNVVLR